jgi:hypothetical protein
MTTKTLHLKTRTWYDNKIEFDVTVKPIEGGEGVWYQVTGADAKGSYFFTQCPPDWALSTKSIVIPKGYYHHENWVNLLRNSGIITGEKIEFYPDLTEESCDTYYPLTDQAIEYANRERVTEPCERKEQKKKRKAKRQKNNKHLAKMSASEVKSSTSTSDDASIMGTEPVEEGGGLKFSLIDIREDELFLPHDSLRTRPLGEFTAPKNLDTYPGGLLEYIVQCARKNGARHGRIGFKLMEYIPDYNWETQEDLCARIIDELVNKHHQAPPHPDETEPFYQLRSITLNKESSEITLPSGTWSWILHHNASVKEKVGPDTKTRYCKAMELVLEDGQEEEYPGLKLKKLEWKGREINLEIEAKKPYSNEQAWYDVVGYYTYIDGQVDFTRYPYDLFRIRGSVAAIEMGEDHDKIVKFLYDAGIITKELVYTSIGISKKYKCYRLTNQALKYAHRKRW